MLKIVITPIYSLVRVRMKQKILSIELKGVSLMMMIKSYSLRLEKLKLALIKYSSNCFINQSILQLKISSKLTKKTN